MNVQTLWHNARLATLQGPGLGIVERGVVAAQDGRIVYAGAAILSPAIFDGAPKGEFALTRMFDAANEQERLFGLRLDGVWMHVGTPDAVNAAEEAFLESVA